MNVLDYSKFIENKKHSLGEFGFDCLWSPDSAFDFQNHIIEKSLKKGRIGVFADTGLGKTLIQLSIAENIVRKTNKRVLILTPLAVAFQFLDEAERIGVDDIEQPVRDLIRRELERAFEQDDKARAGEAQGYKPLGWDCDRKQWERVRSLWANAEVTGAPLAARPVD